MLTKNTLKTPLIYPNDKPRSASLIASHLPEGTGPIASPFLGGGSLELALASRGHKVTGYTDFRLLYDFWNCMRHDPERVYEMAMGFHPIGDPKLFYMLQKKVYQPHDEFLRSALFYVLTLCAEGHAATSGNIEPGTPRFNQLRMLQMSKFECENFAVKLKGYREVLTHTDEFLVCVPPPYIVGNFVHAVTVPERPQIDHAEYASMMSDKTRWIVLYNYHKNLHGLYPNNQIMMLDAASRETQDESRAEEALILGS